MSSLANCYDHSNFVPKSEYDSSVNRQNESMMHKVKDVVSKFFQPSFLFTTSSNEIDSPKRKRQISIEELDDEQQIETIATTTIKNQIIASKSKYLHQPVRDDESQFTDDDDNNNQDVSSIEQDLKEIEQQKKRRRTTNYQQIHTNNRHHENEKTNSTDSISSLSNRRLHRTTSTELNSNERINRIISSTQHFNITSTSNYDPSKSPFFSVDNRKQTETTTTTTNLKSNEFSANYLLATSLTDRPQLSKSNSQQSSATLTNKNRLLSNERKMFGVNYASINSHRLPYIERLRRRTLQDCIRLDRTLDNEPLSISPIDEHKLKTNSSELTRTKVQEKECGIQCNISNVENSIESNKKLQRAFPPIDIQYEALSVPITEKTQSSTQTDSSIQTHSSITIEKVQTSLPKIDITKPKVLGDVTPFSWPKFARAQEEYAKKYPEKCTDTTLSKTNINTNSTVFQQTNTTSNTISKSSTLPMSSLQSVQSIWKCPSCTKEHPAQTASCSLCHGINPNYKKLSAIQSTLPVEKESTIPIPAATTIINQTVTTKENPVITPAPITANPQFSITATKENPVITPIFGFGTAATTTTTKENPVITTTPITTIPQFSITATKENPVISSAPTTTTFQLGTTTTKENSVITPIFGFGTAATTTTKENPVITAAPITTTPQFSIMTTKENPVITPIFGFGTAATTTTTKENPVITPAPITTTLGFGTAATTTTENPVITAAPITTTLQFGTTATTQENPISTDAFRSTFGTTPVISPVVVTKENSVPNNPLSVFGTATTKESFSITSTTPSLGSIPFNQSLASNTSNPIQFGTILQPFSSVSSTSFTAPVTSSTAPSIATATSSIPMSPSSSSSILPIFGPFGSTSTATVAPAIHISSDQSTSLTKELTTSTPFSATNPILFGSSTITPASTTTNLFSTSSTTSTFPLSNNFTSTSTTSAPFQFGTGGFNFGTSSTTTPNNPPFGFTSTASSPNLFAPSTTTSSVSSNTAPFFGTPPFGTTQASTDKSLNSSNNPPVMFGFGSSSNTTTNPIQTPTTSAFSTGGFPFVPPSSSTTVSTFGAAPSALSSSGSSSSFNFGVAPTASTNPTQFPLTGTTSISTISASTVETLNPYSVMSSDSSSTGQRRIRKAKRQLQNYLFMVKVRKTSKPPPDGWDLIEPTLDELEAKMREAELTPHEGKRKVETLWPIFKVHHQKSRYIYDLYYKRKTISKELYDYCLKHSIGDKNLIAQWKKQGYENLCCLRCIQPRDTNFNKKCICRVPKEKLEEGKVVECVHCGCRGCSG
ncbi:unnamed protein product [Rotaria sp. Silwood1]|nr:unnamed protein product [Rotaria sp. Silwood1]